MLICNDNRPSAGQARKPVRPFVALAKQVSNNHKPRTVANRCEHDRRYLSEPSHQGDRVPPEYPIASDVGKALNAAAKARGDYGFGAHWAGQGAPLSHAVPTAQLVETLRAELGESWGEQ